MAPKLKHSVYDSDTHFSINPSTRVIKNESTTKSGLIQFDHNSERFTFEMPKEIEGHDMSLCDIVEIHYINIDSQTKVESHGYYAVDDLQVCKDDPDIVIFSWLISQNATQYVGHLHFLIRFACVDDNNNLLYVWNTAVHTGMSVADGIYNSDFILEDYADVLVKWKAEIQAFKLMDLQQTQSSAVSKGENIWTATFDDGTPEGFSRSFKVLNGEKGETGPTGESAYQIAVRLGHFKGTEEEFIGSLIYPEFYLDGVRLKNVKFSVTGDTLTIETVT